MVGTIFKLKEGILGNPIGTKGVVYETYPGFYNDIGMSIIFENSNYDGFSCRDRELFVEEIGFDKKTSDYEFENVIKLGQDFDKGYWDHVLNLGDDSEKRD